ncbi:MAG: hypothetical protein KKE30_06955 [Gammaproteobacteria bacterium]|nr:hypothetical protein [Gammaproteobacteria bacterium]MBU1556859.1 hypothetical protein [Gammaproteobacteria bacterium]MBU2071073.1 hypothetical protein [Gammaproteobacteria bacterium]MBU2184341.1 hypothetical protein [Gammaproteobacteria bacterium]MBU2206402.1 hypothetical protein [Gammaproteobacteria bacterium]
MNKESKTNLQHAHELTGNSDAGDCAVITADPSGVMDLFADLESSSEGMRKEKSKFRLNHFGNEGFFLPSIEKSIDYILGIPIKQMFDILENGFGRPMPIGRSSRFEMFNGGVGYPTAKKFIDWLRPSFADFSSRCDAFSRELLERGSRELSSAGHWWSFIGGMRCSKAYQQSEFASEYQPQMDFILQRCDADILMRRQINELIKSGEVTKNDSVAIVKLMLPHWQKHSLVPHDELQAYEQGFVLHASGNLVGDEAITAFLRAHCFVYLDFYLQLMASYEVGCVLTYRADQSDLTRKKGLLCRALTRFSQKNDEEAKTTTCFGEFLDEVHDVISKNVVQLSVREMARYIPLNNDVSHSSAETEADRCYNTLKAWRKGKEVPSRELLEQFWASLAEKICPGSAEQLSLMSKMAIGLDKKRKNWAQQLAAAKELKNAAPAIKVFSDVIGHYDAYYQHHLLLNLKK